MRKSLDHIKLLGIAGFYNLWSMLRILLKPFCPIFYVQYIQIFRINFETILVFTVYIIDFVSYNLKSLLLKVSTAAL